MESGSDHGQDKCRQHRLCREKEVWRMCGTANGRRYNLAVHLWARLQPLYIMVQGKMRVIAVDTSTTPLRGHAESRRGQQTLDWIYREQLLFPRRQQQQQQQQQQKPSYRAYNTAQRSRRIDYVLSRSRRENLHAKLEEGVGPQEGRHMVGSDHEPVVAQLLAQKPPRKTSPSMSPTAT